METSTLLIGLIFLLIIYGVNKRSMMVKDDKEELPPPYHPKESMLENYASINEQISGCNDDKTLKDIYISILIFQCCFDDSAGFLDELYKRYSEKEKELFSWG